MIPKDSSSSIAVTVSISVSVVVGIAVAAAIVWLIVAMVRRRRLQMRDYNDTNTTSQMFSPSTSSSSASGDGSTNEYFSSAVQQEKKGNPSPLPYRLVYIHKYNCGFCQKFGPVWMDLKRIYGNVLKRKGVGLAKFDANSNEAKGFGAVSYPTILMTHNGKKIATFSGKRTMAALLTFVQQTLQSHQHR